MKLFNILALLFIFNQFAFAEKKPVTGKIISTTDTLDVVFMISINVESGMPDFEKLQEKFTYTDAANKKVVVRPSEAKEIQFVYRTRTFRMISMENTLMLGSIMTMESKIFLKLDIDGKLKLYTYYNTKSSAMGGGYGPNGMPMATTYSKISYHKSIYQKEDGALMMPDGITFRSDMKNYLSECPLLVEKIENKNFKKDDGLNIVYFYNNNCGK